MHNDMHSNQFIYINCSWDHCQTLHGFISRAWLPFLTQAGWQICPLVTYCLPPGRGQGGRARGEERLFGNFLLAQGMVDGICRVGKNVKLLTSMNSSRHLWFLVPHIKDQNILKKTKNPRIYIYRVSRRIRTVGELGPLIRRIGTTLF